MKKALQIFLVFVWIFSVSGVVVSSHYCGPFLKTTALGHNELHCGDMEEADMPSGCCKNTTEFKSIEDDFLKVSNHQQALPQLFVLYSITLPGFELYQTGSYEQNYRFTNSAGPPYSSPALFITNRSIII